ncbi:hypothetical protein U1Q18_045797 [Sarracenia purpurea var. burkii]
MQDRSSDRGKRGSNAKKKRNCRDDIQCAKKEGGAAGFLLIGAAAVHDMGFQRVDLGADLWLEEDKCSGTI